jgi:serine/threonine protein kinase
MAVKAPVIAGKYTLLRRLGHGGMAEVFLAKQMSEGGFEKLVVLKRILPHLATGPEFVQMFLDEARVAADLRHPNIVTIADVGRAGETLFMVMEFLHGQDIRKVQRKVAAFGQMIPLGHACQMAIDAAAGLNYAHSKRDLNGRALEIVHRDVSPQNIIVTFEGSTKIVDFGIAKAAGQSTHTSTGVLKGKYTYMSPEQAQGEVVDARTDQFALGIVLWELLTMRRLFKRDTEAQTLEAIIDGPIPRPKRFRDDVPASIEDVVMTALSREKHKRFRDCEALAMALEDALSREGVVHSQSRLAQYMRRLFADQLAEEAAIGVVQQDGSLSVKSIFPNAVPERRPDSGDKIEKPRERSERREAPKPETPPARVDEKEPVESTAADRKRSRSVRSAEMARTESEVKKQQPVEVREPPKPVAREPVRERTTERERPRDIVNDGGTRRTALYAGLAAVAGAAAVGVVAVGWLSSSSNGPATLVVRSEPRGARVLLDGADTGQTTPALLKGVTSGEPHKVRLELEGHSPLDEVVTVPRKGTTQDINFTLAPKR